jgi:hypothetical protein
LSITLKAHVIKHHIVAYNNKYGIGDKEESFIEQGHKFKKKEVLEKTKQNSNNNVRKKKLKKEIMKEEK